MSNSLMQTAQQQGIKYFLISYCDLVGTARAKLVPTAAIEAACKNGAGFAGFATWLDMTPADPDLFALPIEATLTRLPWKPEVAWLASDLRMEGQPVAQAPRQVLKNLLARAHDMGYEFCSGVECEFFILQPDGSQIADLADHQQKPCYDQQSLMRGYDLIAEICDAMLALDWGAYQNDHEDANGQFEMNWHFADAMTTADRQVFFKYMVKAIAEKHGRRATFMPKPFSNQTGNGCHFHLSLWDRQTRRNVFHDPSDEVGISRLGYHFLGGILHSAEAICALTNPVVNSYRRINAPTTDSGATWSPNTISYTGNNRTHMVRVPDGGRFEFRLADGAANPYLLAAALLAAGLDGIRRQRDPGPRSDVNMYLEQNLKDARRLPESLRDALDALDRSEVLRGGLGDAFVDAYLKLKRQEWRAAQRHVTPWELETTLDC